MISNERRRILVWMGAAAVAPLVPTPLLADDRPATPRMTEGPFYPTSFPADTDADLTRVSGHARGAEGTVLDVTVPQGVLEDLLDGGAELVADQDVLVRRSDGDERVGAVRSREDELRIDEGGAAEQSVVDVGEPAGSGDPDFQGFGAMMTDAEGRYAFRTIKPVPYPGRTPHIHFTVVENGKRRLTSQMFIEGEPGNARDFLYRDLGRSASLVTMRLADNGKGLAGTLDIVLAA